MGFTLLALAFMAVLAVCMVMPFLSIVQRVKRLEDAASKKPVGRPRGSRNKREPEPEQERLDKMGL